MRKAVGVLALALGFMLVPLTPMHADPFEIELQEVRAEAERIADQFDGDTPDEILARRFFKRVLKALDKRAKSLADDANTAARIAKFLDKAGGLLDELLDDVDIALESIGDRVDNLVSNLEARVEDLPESGKKAKAQKKLTRLRELLATADEDDLVALGKLYKKVLIKRRSAAKLIGKLEKKAGDTEQ